MKTIVKKTAYYWVLELLSIASLLYTFYPLVFFCHLDKNIKIPIHYNLLGEIDGWGSRNFLFFLPVIAVLLYGLFLFVESYPKFINYPFSTKNIDKDVLNRTGIAMMRHLKPVIIFTFAYLNNNSFNVAVGKSNATSVVVFLLTGLFLIPGFFMIRFFRQRTKKESDK
ncbi:hypothetical protein FACS1894178_6390 [Bacteroidia bacterium]|nr:hypothetical protein FACS1894178_6390 [Bacteroidia bacterium]